MLNDSAIPEELKQFHQWIVWKSIPNGEKKPLKVPFSVKGYPCDITNSTSYSDFDTAVTAYNTGGYSGIGFCLTENDPFAFIDLDYSEDQAIIGLQTEIYNRFQSYSEISPSGKGLHIIVKGSISTAKKAGKIELYDKARYMTVTGNAYLSAPVRECQADLDDLYRYLGGISSGSGQDFDIETLDKPSSVPDSEVLRVAFAAQNGQFVYDLYTGNWQKHSHKWHDQSQSSADQALINCLQFYTRDRKQIERLFKSSNLYREEKKHTIKYNIKKAFDRTAKEMDLSGFIAETEKRLSMNQPKQKEEKEVSKEHKSHFEYPSNPFHVLPPGVVGELANCYYQCAVRPVEEFAIAASLSLCAGIVGKAYNIAGTGLNTFIAAIGETGFGKETPAQATSILSYVAKVNPTAIDFAGPQDIASPQGLLKMLGERPSFLSVFDEFGRELKEMLSGRSSKRPLEKAFLSLYSKSGSGAITGGFAYSDQDKNKEAISSPAFSLLGVSTPASFYENIDERTMGSGFLNRFTIIEYKGDRPAYREDKARFEHFPELIDKLSKLCANASMLNSQERVINVQLSEDAAQYFREYNLDIDRRINKASQIEKEMLVRSHLKALKLAAIVAVGINPYNPTIDIDAARWAIGVEEYCTSNLLSRFDAGETGTDFDLSEIAQEKAMKKIIKEYVFGTHDTLDGDSRKYTTKELVASHVIPASYIQRKVRKLAPFKNDKFGPANATEKIIRLFVTAGILQQLSPIELQAFNRKGHHYAIDARNF